MGPRTLDKKILLFRCKNVVDRLDDLGLRRGVEGHHDRRVQGTVVIGDQELVVAGDRVHECTRIFFLVLGLHRREHEMLLVKHVHHEPDQHLLGFKHGGERHAGFRGSHDGKLEHAHLQFNLFQQSNVLEVIQDELIPVVLP